jgi:biopolymer transport protein TolR
MTPKRGRRLMGEINVVPYIDVMLVLLIIFMITAPLMTQGVKVDLPKASAQPVQATNKQSLVLSVDKSGRYYLNLGSNEKQPISETEVTNRVSAVMRREPSTPVYVNADESVPYGVVVQGMALLQRAGAEQVSLLTDQASTARKRN